MTMNSVLFSYIITLKGGRSLAEIDVMREFSKIRFKKTPFKKALLVSTDRSNRQEEDEDASSNLLEETNHDNYYMRGNYSTVMFSKIIQNEIIISHNFGDHLNDSQIAKLGSDLEKIFLALNNLQFPADDMLYEFQTLINVSTDRNPYDVMANSSNYHKSIFTGNMKLDLSKNRICFSLSEDTLDKKVDNDNTSTSNPKFRYLNKVSLSPKIGKYLVQLDYKIPNSSHLLVSVKNVENLAKEIIDKIES